MKAFRYFGLISFFLLAFMFVACKNDIVSATTFDFDEKKNAADYDDFILPPDKIEASHGESKAVTLSWTPVKNAVQYYIYSAATPYDVFNKISETKGDETEIIVDEEAGVTKYYCICAVNYYGTVSAKSVVVMGSSLAVPIITEIEASEEGDSVTVEWWMDNCSDLTYQNDINFYVYTSLKTSPNIKFKTLTVTGNTRNIRIDGLISKTEYLFEVEAVNTQNGNKEPSGQYSAETAHRVLPDAPAGFTVTKGQSLSEVVLSWQTPSGAWYRENSGSSGFVLHPIYFEIYRKDNDKIKKIGTLRLKLTDNQPLKQGETEIVFTDADKTTCSHLDNSPYDKYFIGATITFTDTIESENRGKVYSYYVQSITDDIKGKRITSESSCTQEVDGWTVGVPQFSIKSDYVKNSEGNTFTDISFKYNLKFENRGVPYSYFIKKEKLALDDGVTQDGEPEWLTFSSVESINSKVDEFAPVQGSPQNGYYLYTLFVCVAGTDVADCESAEANFYTIPASGKYIVTDDVNSIPKIENFSVEDGYADKFNLSWKYNSKYVYTIHWWEMNGSQKGNKEFKVITPEQNWTDGKIVTYSHTGVVSGSRRIYELEASTGISETAKIFTDGTELEEMIFETLGTAEPSFTTYDYNTITVTWPKVQKALDSNYTVSAKYDGSDVELVNDTNTVIRLLEGEDVYECVITEPDGYNNANVSGKKINLTVTAQNDSDTTKSQAIAVCTLGPALAGTKVLGIEEKSITIQWNKIEGAAGYIITRNSRVADEDIYFFDGSSIAVNEAAVDNNYAEIRENSNGTYTFIDKAVDNIDVTNPYTINQACIEWGLPFDYTVVPVKADSTSNTVAYTNLEPKTGVAKGFGLNVHAQKSESSEKQIVEWTKPNTVDISSSPVLYYRGYNDDGSVENKWKKLSVEFESSNTKTKTKPFIPPFSPDTKTEAFEYLVAYGRSTSELTKVPQSLLQDSTNGGLATLETAYTYTDVPVEKANKGYLLAVDYKVHTGSNNSERVDWDEWDYSKRSLGPDSAILSICNYNLGNTWTEVATLDKDMHYVSTGTGLVNTTVTKHNGTELSLKPTVLMDGSKNNPVTKGHLQVLRDARHYYAITLSRGGASYELGKDNSVYGYREITDLEFAKMVMVLFSNPMDYIGKLDDKNDSLPDSSVVYNHQGALSPDFIFTYTNYAPEFEVPSGIVQSQLSISCTGTAKRSQAGIGGYPKTILSTKITAKKLDNKMPDCYTGSISFELTDQKVAYINGQNYSGDVRRIFVPFKIYGDDTSYYKNSSYGWWN
ncbi:MAG: fibronectin type III domain-containing protein [Treponema sp.]|nr:fibronectin type III domain-containing protein [Treponema sp.]